MEYTHSIGMQKTIETARFIINDLREKKGITDIDTFVFRLRNSTLVLVS